MQRAVNDNNIMPSFLAYYCAILLALNTLKCMHIGTNKVILLGSM